MEPTRQQIKEAFNKTIERWEKIVERPSYYHKSHCFLCRVYDGTDICHKFCPIRDYGMGNERSVCGNTPYHVFTQDKTPANALAELNFLRKVYIWWTEGEGKDSMGEPLRGYKKEEKKERCGTCEDFRPVENEDYGYCGDVTKSKAIRWLPSDSCSLWRMKKAKKKGERKVGACRAFGCKSLLVDGGCSYPGHCMHKSPEKKKEEWVDVTRQITWRLDGVFDKCCSLTGTYGGEKIVVAANNGIKLFAGKENRYRTEHGDNGHRVFKKA